ncbi:MAG: 50S ribosomal protein L3 [Cytophagia bacterium]|nr:MAG: 50S ribosomal protein L3 [Cytophagales bacterium]TAG04831.1 MAG: 50S ribosomal protein L3 [Cytophagia bacterium]TAG43597.1 MAG: 50S ribosomal protein L3 [Cytophagia bacterium]TAH30212.1 MAG: 50S ribosomal protein L3 [Cytophagales bacterium]
MSGIIGKKIGMTNIFQSDEASTKQIACTLLQVGPCVVTQVKTKETDGYDAIQLAYGEKKPKNTSKAMKVHFEKANTTPKFKVIEFKGFAKGKYQLGDVITVSDIFSEKDVVNVIGTSKGKGFQGVVKRHGFSGVGATTHGQHDRARHPGSIGASSFPSRVFKGLRMAGRMGGDRIKTKNLKVLRIYAEDNAILVSGSVAGANNSYITIEKIS